MKIFVLDNDSKYSILSRFFHWFRFLLLVFIYLLAYKKVLFPTEFLEYLVPFKIILKHKVLGIILFITISLNIVWKFFNKSPKSFAGSNLEENIEKLVHIAMYSLIFFIPIIGYFSSIKTINVLGIPVYSIYSFEWFTMYLENTLKIDVFTFISLLSYFHKFLTTILLCLAGLHIFVIIFNKIFRKTSELKRMM